MALIPEQRCGGEFQLVFNRVAAACWNTESFLYGTGNSHAGDTLIGPGHLYAGRPVAIDRHLGSTDRQWLGMLNFLTAKFLFCVGFWAACFAAFEKPAVVTDLYRRWQRIAGRIFLSIFTRYFLVLTYAPVDTVGGGCMAGLAVKPSSPLGGCSGCQQTSPVFNAGPCGNGGDL